MSDSANTTPRLDSLGRPIAAGFGGVQEGAGRPPWQFTDEIKADVIAAARKGMRLNDLARIALLNVQTFAKKRAENPAIDEAIEEGRALGRADLLNLSHQIITDRRDPA